MKINLNMVFWDGKKIINEILTTALASLLQVKHLLDLFTCTMATGAGNL